MYCVFFFKQKTAYEMRISDWSSDVCSSDLSLPRMSMSSVTCGRWDVIAPHIWPQRGVSSDDGPVCSKARMNSATMRWNGWGIRRAPACFCEGSPPAWSRSEEHTSELQSLMRISYAVFCLHNKHKQHDLHNS